MNSRTHPPSCDTVNTVGPIAAPEDVGASSVPWVGAGVFETIDGYASQGLRAGLRPYLTSWRHAHQSLELHSALAHGAPERAREKLDLARDATRTALDQTRNLSARLARHQTEETREGLACALRELLQTHLPDGVEADLSARGEQTALPHHVREQAYLVMREAVRNAVGHSGCGRVGVSVEVENGELRGRVEDDGEGLDLREGPGMGRDDGEGGAPSAGVGLSSMKERTEMLGGRLEVSSHPGQGTAVEVRVPLAD